ncbi:MAG: SRPBCC domain-containing protein [Promethearchaeota archaeon]
MDKILHHFIRLNCDTKRAFEMFTVNRFLEMWLTTEANVEPVVGGKYELYWNPTDKENDSTIGCKITTIEKDKLISFEWKGPKEFKEFMNNADPLTHVVVSFIPHRENTESWTDVHLIHSGWRQTDDWEKARQMFERAWSDAFEELRKLINEHSHSNSSSTGCPLSS